MLPIIHGPFWVTTVTTNQQFWTFKDPDLDNNNFRNYSRRFLSFH